MKIDYDKLQTTILWVQVLAKLMISFVMVVLGFSLVFVKHPSLAFEIAIVYRYSKYHGITVMDIIALLIVLSGFYLFVNASLQALKLWTTKKQLDQD